MKEYEIRKDFHELEEFTINLKNTFDHIGSVILDNRNVVKKVVTESGTVVIKNFKGMYFFNRLAYSFLRKSKAERSFLNSEILNKKGIITPAHVSWVDFSSYGLLSHSYFISVFSPYKTLRQILESDDFTQQYKDDMLDQLSVFVRKLHDLEVYQNDFSLGNILVIPGENGFEFSMIDLNRVRFQKVSFRKGLQNFSKLEIPTEALNKLIGQYASLSGQSPEQSVALFWKDRNRSFVIRRARKRLRHYTLTQVEKLLGMKK